MNVPHHVRGTFINIIIVILSMPPPLGGHY